MAYNPDFHPSCKIEIEKMCYKNKTLSNALEKKISHILEMPHHFKPLRFPLQNRRRVHVLKSFILTYEIIEESKTVSFLTFEHHDKGYSILRLL